MPSVQKVFALLFVLLLAACDQVGRVPTSATAIVGTKAVIKAHREEMIAEVTDVAGKLVTTEFTNWDGEHLFTRTHYRGLFPVSGTEMDGSRWEVDFDETQLESMFPLEPGNETAFTGQIMRYDEGESIDLWAQLHVAGNKTLSMPDGKRNVVVVEFTMQYKFRGTTELRTEIIYFDPEYSMVLKKVQRKRGSQTYWRVVKVERPGSATSSPTPRPRRTGTVMI